MSWMVCFNSPFCSRACHLADVRAGARCSSATLAPAIFRSPFGALPSRCARTVPCVLADSADVTLSPMHAPQERPAQRKDEPADQETWTNGLFSPVLKFFNGEDGSESEVRLASCPSVLMC